MVRQAMLLVADEVFYNLHGKAILHGIYHSDLIITRNPQPAPQLVFFFMIETDADDPFRSLAVEVKLPNSDPIRRPIFLARSIPADMVVQKTRLFLRHPLLVQAPLLQPGRIEAKVVHEGGEIIVPTHSIMEVAQPPVPPQKPN